jgi:hypothetical protein
VCGDGNIHPLLVVALKIGGFAAKIGLPRGSYYDLKIFFSLLYTPPQLGNCMATKKTRSFEIFETITANAAGNVASIDLNTFVNVADLEAFGVQSIEVGVNATATNQPTAIYQVQVALENLANGFINHAEYDSIYLKFSDALTSAFDESLSLGDVSEIRYIPGGLLSVRADRLTGAADVDLYIRVTGVISKLSAADYMSLALTRSANL